MACWMRNIRARPNYWGALLWRQLMGSTGARFGSANFKRASMSMPMPTRDARWRELLIINTDRNAPHSLMLPTGYCVTHWKRQLTGSDVRLTAVRWRWTRGMSCRRSPALRRRQYCDVQAGHNHLPGHSDGRKQHLSVTGVERIHGRICSNGRCGSVFIFLKRLLWGILQRACPGRDRLVPPCRFSMLDCDRCISAVSAACAADLSVPGAGRRLKSPHRRSCDRSVVDAIFGWLTELHQSATELLDHGASVDARDRFGARPLSHAARFAISRWLIFCWRATLRSMRHLAAPRAVFCRRTRAYRDRQRLIERGARRQFRRASGVSPVLPPRMWATTRSSKRCSHVEPTNERPTKPASRRSSMRRPAHGSTS